MLLSIQQLDHLQVHAATATAQSPVKVKAEVIKDGFVTYAVNLSLIKQNVFFSSLSLLNGTFIYLDSYALFVVHKDNAKQEDNIRNLLRWQ